MAGTVTTFNSDNRSIERDPITLVFEVEAQLGATSSTDEVLMAMPAGVTYLCAEIQCIVAEAGATSSVCSLVHGATAILTGSADNGGTANTIDDGVSSGTFVANADTSAAGNLIADINIVGTSTTAAKWRIHVTCLRTSF